jgi:hypothetical protein
MARTSDLIGGIYSVTAGMVVQHSQTRLLHLLHDMAERCECGTASGGMDPFEDLTKMTEYGWCYSCVGNALRRLEAT